MQILARTYHVAHGVPPRRFAVTFEIRGTGRVRVESEGRTWLLKLAGESAYRPGSRCHIEAAIEKALEIERREHQGRELVTADACRCHRDAALPVGDR